jgi:glycosyltransferase involved in cell wall biosynthesis
MRLTVCIPAYNEAKTIGAVVDGIPREIAGFDEVTVVVVDDGSTDGTADVAEKHGARTVVHRRNLGLGVAFRSALEEALELRSDAMVTIDADGQFAATEISLLLAPIVEGRADLATGSRFIDPAKIPANMPAVKKWGNRMVARIVSLAIGRRLYDCSCGFRAYGKSALLHLNLSGRFTYTQETLLDLAYKDQHIVEVPVTVTYCDERQSRIAGSVIQYGVKAGHIILRTVIDQHPLRFFGSCGLFVFLVGLLCDGYLLLHYLQAQSFSPYKFLGFIGGFCNAMGLLLVLLGILGSLIDRVRQTQEALLYEHKKALYR